MTKQTKLLTGLLAGAAIGAVVALIVSSNKDNDVKDQLSNWFCDLLNTSKDKMNAATEVVKDKISKVKA
jgi:gas vesicle protein